MQPTSGPLSQNWCLKTVLLLAAACLLIRCSHSGVEESGDPSFDTYFKAGSTYIGISTVVENLDVPWEITWGPNDWIWMTENGGRVSKINPASGEKKVMLKIRDVFEGTTPGLLGMAVHPDQEHFPYLFLIYNSEEGEGSVFWNLVRYTIDADTLRDRQNLLMRQASEHHQGSRVKISPDGKLIVANGDAGMDAQDVSSPFGKTLRLNIDGSNPKDNPFPGSPVWAWGFRNQQGLTYGDDGILYASDHGPANDDEINIIKKGQNYGWPAVKGFCDKPEEQTFCADSSVAEPMKAWTPTIAPAGIAYYKHETIPEWQNSILLTTLKNASLHVLSLSETGRSIDKEMVYLTDQYGRLRDVAVSPTGDIYISTSNRDWKPDPGEGLPALGDDRIIRLSKVENKSFLKGLPSVQEMESESTKEKKKMSQGALTYQEYCASCHRPDGGGIKDVFPPLAESKLVNSDKDRLISIVLEGQQTEKYNEEMPAFSFLSDQEVAELLTYIRSNFENHASKIMEQQVKDMRKDIFGKK